jgi:hypothetical protein
VDARQLGDEALGDDQGHLDPDALAQALHADGALGIGQCAATNPLDLGLLRISVVIGRSGPTRRRPLTPDCFRRLS